MKKLTLLALMSLGVTQAVLAGSFGDVLVPTAVGAGIGGAIGGGRGAGIGAAVGFGAGALSSSARHRGYYDDGYYYGDGYYHSRPAVGYYSSRPIRYRRGLGYSTPYRSSAVRYTADIDNSKWSRSPNASDATVSVDVAPKANEAEVIIAD